MALEFYCDILDGYCYNINFSISDLVLHWEEEIILQYIFWSENICISEVF